MTQSMRAVVTLIIAAMVAPTLPNPRSASAGTAVGVDEDVNAALKKLYASEPVAKMIGEKAKAVLVFPNIIKAGFIVGGHYGEGALLK